MEDKRIEEVKKILEDLGCGEVEVGPNFEVRQIESHLFEKKIISFGEGRENQRAIVAARTPFGGFAWGKFNNVQIFNYESEFVRSVFSTISDKGIKIVLGKVMSVLLKKK